MTQSYQGEDRIWATSPSTSVYLGGDISAPTADRRVGTPLCVLTGSEGN